MSESSVLGNASPLQRRSARPGMSMRSDNFGNDVVVPIKLFSREYHFLKPNWLHIAIRRKSVTQVTIIKALKYPDPPAAGKTGETISPIL